MKLFTNKGWLFIGICVFINACSAKEEPANQIPEITETITVQETVFPPAAAQPAAEPVAKAQIATPAASGKTTANTLYPNEALINVKAWDSKLKSLNTRFEQTTSYDGVTISKSQGALYYDKAKNLLRLDTLNTDGKTEQTAITDKKQILILDGQGHEITTLSWQEWQQGQPNQALFDFGNYTALLARHHAVLKEPYLLELTPKEGEKYTLYLTLSQADYFPTHIKIVSDLMETEAVLSDTQKNEPLAFDTFRLGGMFK